MAVGSVFVGGSRRWHEIQTGWLRRTSANFRHFVYLVDGDSSEFPGSEVIGHCTTNSLGVSPELIGNTSHIMGLNAIGDFFRANRFRRYLILDSDCFPIKGGWTNDLDGMMERYGSRFASPSRLEDFVYAPHPCAIYTKDPDLLRFDKVDYQNLVGGGLWDTSLVDRSGWLPLLKTNRWSPHPIIGSVYLGFFYHHGAGSRGFTAHSFNAGYYSHLKLEDPPKILARFARDPDDFIARCVGEIEA